MDENKKTHKSMKNIGVIIAFIVVVVMIGAIVIARVFKRAHQANMMPQTYTNSVPVTTATTTPTPTPVDTSNTQLDQDVQNAQSGLNNVNNDLNTSSQTITNQSADTPQ